MMTLEELDKKLAAEPTYSRPTVFETYWEKMEMRRELRIKEDEALKRGCCPHCPHSVVRDVSKHTNTIYYTCNNPDKMLGHIYLRTKYDDPRRAGQEACERTDDEDYYHE